MDKLKVKIKNKLKMHYKGNIGRRVFHFKFSIQSKLIIVVIGYYYYPVGGLTEI